MLSFFSIFGIQNNLKTVNSTRLIVVNCFHFSVSLGYKTTLLFYCNCWSLLWIAFIFQYLWDTKQLISFTETDQDRYGRTIAKVFYDNGKYLSEEIIRNGFGWFYFKYSNNKKLESLHYEAKENKRGLWFDKNAISPYEWRQLNK